MSIIPDIDRQLNAINQQLNAINQLLVNQNIRLARVERKVDAISEKLGQVLDGESKIMATLDDVLKDVSDENTLDDSIIALLTGVKQQLTEALAGTTLPPAVQTKIDSVFTSLEANKQKVTDAITANTPAAP